MCTKEKIAGWDGVDTRSWSDFVNTPPIFYSSGMTMTIVKVSLSCMLVAISLARIVCSHAPSSRITDSLYAISMNTFGSGSGRHLTPNNNNDNNKRRGPPHPSSIPAKRAQVAAACQNCRAKKTKVGRYAILQNILRYQSGWFLTRIIHSATRAVLAHLARIATSSASMTLSVANPRRRPSSASMRRRASSSRRRRSSSV
jgi:hypothetical protein